MIEGDFSFLGKNTIKTGYEPHYMGYYYIFPKGQDIANVGVGRFNLNRKNQGPHLKKELDRVLREEGLDGYMIKKEVHSFSPSCSVNRLVWGNTLLVGEAAGLSSPLHGGGIDMACISGRLAAEHIASNQVPQYPTRLWNILGKKTTMETRVSNLWQIFGYPFCLGILKYPGLLPAVVFNKPPFPQVLGFRAKRIF
jgi:digeranylgeranylglycerophospholipid reductase